MESKIYFSNSMGEKEELESLEWLKDKVFNGDDEFWEGATGDVGLNYVGEKFVTALGLIGRDEFGFMLDYLGEDVERTLSLRYGKQVGETVAAETGGEPTIYFKEYCMPKEIAWEVIEYFLKTGGRNPKYIWEIADYPKQSWEEND